MLDTGMFVFLTLEVVARREKPEWGHSGRKGSSNPANLKLWVAIHKWVTT